MQVHTDKQVQHASGDRLQGSACDNGEGVNKKTGNGDYFILDRSSFNQGENAKYDMIITRGGSADTGGKRAARSSYPCPTWSKVGALCATDYKWVQQEQVEQGKIIPVLRR